MLAAILPALALAAGTLLIWTTRLSTPSETYLVLLGDMYSYFLPGYAYQAARMAEGSLPLWNPYQAVGTPFLATLQPGVLYPARLLLLVMAPERAMGVSACLHLLLLVVTAYPLARALGTSRLAACGAGLVTGATFGASWIYSPVYLEAGAWWPTLALALVRVVGGGGWRWVALLGVSGAMPVLAGGYQMTLYMAYALGLLALGLLADSRFRAGSWGGLLLRLGVAGMIALATAAPQLLPTLAWSAETARRTEPLTDLQLYPFGSPPASTLAYQTLFGGVDAQFVRLSLPAAALALLGFARQRALGLALGVGALVLYGIALGPGSPLFALYRVLPLLDVYRFPFRLLMSVQLLLAVGVAFGLDACQRWRPSRWPRLGFAAAAGAFALLLATLVAPIRNLSQLPWIQPGPLVYVSPVLELAASRVGDGRVAFSGSLVVARYAMLGSVRSVQDYEPLASRRLQQYLYALAGQPVPPSDAPAQFLGALMGAEPLAQPRLLDLLSTRVVVASPPALKDVTLDGLQPVAAAGMGRVYLNPNALPRAYTVPRARFVATEDAALAAIQAPDFDPRGEAVLVGTPTEGAEQAIAGGDGPAFAGARIVLDDAEHVEIDVDVAAPAVLVLTDAFAPGWEARVDGRPRRIWQANHLVRGVVLQPGERRVAFVYRAPGWRLGWAVFAVGWLAAAGVVASARRTR